mmetsp:Transcript_45983/g.76025  ORF Transcript_45983/g.76025 Transcript_45983/m.76025 type:complete len:332 (-) Transcript_45983:232-1227(-)
MRMNDRSRLGCTMLCLLCKLTRASKMLHWTIRSSDLEATLNFTTQVLGMRVLRHEENDSPCPIRCNGAFDTWWSKTLVGYGPEDQAYALEVIYNYGVDHYTRGNGLERFELSLPNIKLSLAEAMARGFFTEEIKGGALSITGPDGYVFHLRNQTDPNRDPFDAVVINAKEPMAVAAWYMLMFSMQVHHDIDLDYKFHRYPEHTNGLSFKGQNSVKLIVEPVAEAPTPSVWDGRGAIGAPGNHIKSINIKLNLDDPTQIMHPLQELEEKLGTLYIIVMQDPTGQELALVSIETFDSSVREATNYIGPDWQLRQVLHQRALETLEAKRNKDEI